MLVDHFSPSFQSRVPCVLLNAKKLEVTIVEVDQT